MEKRKLSVYRGGTRNYEPIPRITLQGHWLESLGFSIGDSLTVHCRAGELIISNVHTITDGEVEKENIAIESRNNDIHSVQ